MLKKYHLHYLLPLLLTLLVYSQVVSYGFVWDDLSIFIDNSGLRTAGWEKVILQPLSISTNYFRPLALAMLAMELQWFDVSPVVMHAMNLLVFALNVWLVIFITSRLASRLLPDGRGELAGLLAGALYASHPVLVEPVSWISCRFDLLMTFFSLLGIFCFLTSKKDSTRVLSVSLSFLLAAFSKESAAVFPPLLLCLIFAMEAKEQGFSALLAVFRRHLALFAALFGCGLLYLFIRHSVIGYLMVADFMLDPGNALQHLLLTGKSFYWYLRLIFFPFVGSSPYHEADTPIALSDLEGWAGIVSLVLLPTAVFYLSRKPDLRSLAWLILGWGVTMLPYLHIIQPMTMGKNIVQERFLTFPMVMIAITFGVVSARFLGGEKRRVYLLLAAIWIGMAGLVAKLNSSFWANEVSLWTWVVHEKPESPMAQLQLSTAYLNNQQFERALVVGEKAHQEASRFSEREKRLKQSAIVSHAMALSALQRHQEAVKVAQEGLAVGSPSATNWANIGEVMLDAGNYNDAVMYLGLAHSFEPGRWRYERNLGLALEKLGRHEEARMHLTNAARKAPQAQ